MVRKEMDSQFKGMIKEDRSAPSNLPRDVVMKQYPKCEYMSYELDDTMRGLDGDRRADIKSINRHKSDTKW